MSNAKGVINQAIQDIILQCQRDRLLKQTADLYAAGQRMLSKNRRLVMLNVPKNYYETQAWKS